MILVAPAHALGELSHALDAPTQRKIAAQLQKNLTNVPYHKFAKRLNGNVFLLASTVQNDDATNVAIGGKGVDLYFVNETGSNPDFVVDQTRRRK